MFVSSTKTILKRVNNNDYRNWELPYGAFRMFNTTHSPNYEIVWLYQIVLMNIIALAYCSAALILSGILSYVCTQFQMLQNCLKRILRNSYNEMMMDTRSKNTHLYSVTDPELDPSNIPWKYLHISLKKMVLYHLSIIEIVKEIEEVFSLSIMSTFLTFLVMLCIQVYRASIIPLNDVSFLGIMVETLSIFVLLLMVCYWGEQVAYESQEVGRAAYEANFVGADLRFQKALAVIIHRSQNPTRIKAGKFIEISMVTFAWIFRSAYSSYMMLKRMKTS